MQPPKLSVKFRSSKTVRRSSLWEALFRVLLLAGILSLLPSLQSALLSPPLLPLRQQNQALLLPLLLRLLTVKMRMMRKMKEDEMKMRKMFDEDEDDDPLLINRVKSHHAIQLMNLSIVYICAFV